MSDIEYAYLQNDIFQMWKDDEDKMLEKLNELNQEYLAKSEVYQKNLCDTRFRADSQIEIADKISMTYSDMLFLFMLVMCCFNNGSNNEPDNVKGA